MLGRLPHERGRPSRQPPHSLFMDLLWLVQGGKNASHYECSNAALRAIAYVLAFVATKA